MYYNHASHAKTLWPPLPHLFITPDPAALTKVTQVFTLAP